MYSNLLSNLDLRNNKYELEVLKEHIYSIDLFEILKTQIIDEEFAVNYILNKVFQLTKEEENINLTDIMKYQPHLNTSLLYRIFIIGPLPSSILIPSFENCI
jgi:hypothetical protein